MLNTESASLLTRLQSRERKIDLTGKDPALLMRELVAGGKVKELSVDDIKNINQATNICMMSIDPPKLLVIDLLNMKDDKLLNLKEMLIDGINELNAELKLEKPISNVFEILPAAVGGRRSKNQRKSRNQRRSRKQRNQRKSRRSRR